MFSKAKLKDMFAAQRRFKADIAYAINLSEVTTADLATGCGVSPRTINRWLKNPEKLSLEDLRTLNSCLSTQINPANFIKAAGFEYTER